MRQLTRSKESSESSIETTKDQLKDGEPETSGQPEEENTFPNSLGSPRGISFRDAPRAKDVEEFKFLTDESPKLKVPTGPPEDPYEIRKPSFGTRNQGSARIGQLAKEEPFKSRVTTKGFVNAIIEHTDEEGEPDIDENRPGDFIEQCLSRVFSEPASFPRIIHVRLKAAAWILGVPLAEVERYLEQMPEAEPLSDGWWVLTIDERLQLVSP